MRRIGLVLTTLLMFACGTPAPVVSGLSSLDGLTPTQFFGTEATVVVFVSVDCPISNRYAPELEQLRAAYAARKVQFQLIYVGSASDEVIKKHRTDYRLQWNAWRDVERTLINQVEATVTPEAALFDSKFQLVYRGRIDDRYVAFGKARQDASQHDLRDALEAVLANHRVAAARTKAIGCYIADLQP